MQLRDGQLVFSPTDLTKHQACGHLTYLDLQVAQKSLSPPTGQADEELELIFSLGLAHERGYLRALSQQGLAIVDMSPQGDIADPRAAERRTLQAMQDGADVIYQGTLSDGLWTGRPDFLLRVDRPSGLGDWSYEIADTKLARRMKVPALLQMATYAHRLGELQGRPPDHLYVVTGDRESRSWRLIDVAAYARQARRRLETFIASPPATAAVPVTHCGQCRWAARCAAEWLREDDLSLVAGMRRDHREALRAAGIFTLAQLGRCSADELKPTGIGAASRERLVQQAWQQLDERRTGRPSYTLLPPIERMGLLRLPPPSDGDLYLDFEGDPYAEEGEGREYLAGLGDRPGRYLSLWAHSRAAEQQLTMDLVDRIREQWRAYPDMHVYHYAPYETAALKRLCGRYGVREAELDELLRGERFVDLYGVVRQSMRISKGSYSIKKMEAFYWGQVRSQNEDVADAMSSVLAYERWMSEPAPALLDDIERYNRDDVKSTLDLHNWLEDRRGELEVKHGPLPRPVSEGEPDRPLSDAERDELLLAERLRSADQELLANLVQWHRREDRPAWWDVFRLENLDDDELIEDSSAIGGLSAPYVVGTEKRSNVYEYRFSPQDTRLRIGGRPSDVDSHVSVGEIVDLDAAAGWIQVKRRGDPVRSRGFGGESPLHTGVLRSAIASTGEDVLRGRATLGSALIARTVPPGTRLLQGETAADAVSRVGLSLNGTVLAVQGPPGSGKTTAGAALIRELLDAGYSVGVTANSHAVIGHLLRSTCQPALHKCEADQHCGADTVAWSSDNSFVVNELTSGSARLVGGTAWLWARTDLEQAVDVLIVDEAGQFSLANAVAASRAARRGAVLLGDPQQLRQPTQAIHPEGAGVSALEHFLAGDDTIAPDAGIFLDRTWRMHPGITAFVSDLAYDGRLTAEPALERQTVLAGGLVSGSGLRVVPVPSTGTAAASQAEANAVADLWNSLRDATWQDKEGQHHSIGNDGILVVAPYNNQVGLIRAVLPPGARVGTVDKFQGQEAPVVIYSMTSSSADDAPRGISFLYDLHRLNVAVSRAKALAVVVMNLELLNAHVHNPQQLREVNALCRLAELAAM